MTEPLATGEAGTATENPKARYACPECGLPFEYAMHMGSHRKREHGVETQGRTQTKRKRTGGGGGRPSKATSLKRDLASGAKALAMLPLLRNPQVLADPRVVDVIDSEANAFADAWVAVAEKDARVAKWLNTLLTGSVWINASVASLTFPYSVAVFSGLAPLHPALTMVMPDLAQFIPPPAQAAPVSTSNGDGSVEP